MGTPGIPTHESMILVNSPPLPLPTRPAGVSSKAGGGGKDRIRALTAEDGLTGVLDHRRTLLELRFG